MARRVRPHRARHESRWTATETSRARTWRRSMPRSVLVGGRNRRLTDGCRRGGPSRLPGWTRGHVLTHLARERGRPAAHGRGSAAERGASTSIPVGRATRRRHRSRRGPTDRRAASPTCTRARTRSWPRGALVPDGAWGRLTRARAGTRPVRDGVMSRWRELLVHLVDLDVGVTPTPQLPRRLLAPATPTGSTERPHPRPTLAGAPAPGESADPGSPRPKRCRAGRRTRCLRGRRARPS